MFDNPSPLAYEIVELILAWRARRRLKLYACCLMPDHLHLLASHRLADNVSDMMRDLKLRTTERVWRLGHQGRLWQKSFHDHILRGRDSEQTVAAYVLENPVRKGIAPSAAVYPYSGTPDGADIGFTKREG